MAFGGKDVSSEQVSKYIRPGIQNVTIKSVVGETNQNGNPVIKMSFTLVGGTDATDFRFFMSPNAEEVSLKKIRHIVTKVAKDQDYLDCKGDTVEEYGANLNELLAGKSLRMKFTGEEYLKQDGNVGVRSNVGLPNFAEPIEDGAEYPVVAEENSKLVYDKSSKYDFKKLAVTPSTTVMDDGSNPEFFTKNDSDLEF